MRDMRGNNLPDWNLPIYSPIDPQKLKVLQVKEKLDNEDLLYLKENLPANMYESFLLEKRQKIYPQAAPVSHPQVLFKSGSHLSPQALPSSDLARDKMSSDFNALHSCIQQRVQAPVDHCNSNRCP